MTSALLIFARYPEIGKCKTRLIGELGANGATELHKRLTQFTLNWAREFSVQFGVDLHVVFHGGDMANMQQQFGAEFNYEPQIDGDLGQKMHVAINARFSAGADRVIVVGTDCPELSCSLAASALDRLTSHDICFAPATDGGYTLLGIRRESSVARERLLNSLFRDIPWGTEQVLPLSIERAMQLGATVSLLPTLADVDVPLDLPRGLAALQRSPCPPRLSVIVPVYGEEPLLSEAIDSALQAESCEVIVAAANSITNLPVAMNKQAQWIETKAGRGHQMNCAAKLARGEFLLFLHADSRLPANFADAVVSVFDAPQSAKPCVAGAFRLQVDSSGWKLRLVELGVQLRSRWLSLPYGDQAIFMRKSTFDELGGFREQPIMEDYELVCRLRKKGSIARLGLSVTTSARRWVRLGVIRTTIRNQCMLIGYYLGVPLEKLATYYRRSK
ncbi:MAG: TIGR04283 family arsenosugar biosynthesis glycosyltransferase [Pirellulaceae bacterium]